MTFVFNYFFQMFCANNSAEVKRFLLCDKAYTKATNAQVNTKQIKSMKRLANQYRTAFDIDSFNTVVTVTTILLCAYVKQQKRQLDLQNTTTTAFYTSIQILTVYFALDECAVYFLFAAHVPDKKWKWEEAEH